MNAFFLVIDLTEHSGRLAEMLAAPMDRFLYQSPSIQNMMQSGLIKQDKSASGLTSNMFGKSSFLKQKDITLWLCPPQTDVGFFTL